MSARQLFILALLLIGSAGFQYVALRHFLLSAAGARLNAAVHQPIADYQAEVAGGTAPAVAAQDLVRAVADPNTLAWVMGPNGSIWAQAPGPAPVSTSRGSQAPLAPLPGAHRPPQPPGATITGGDLTLRVPLPTPGTPQQATLIVATPIQDVLGVLASEIRLLLFGGLAALVIGGLSGAWAVRQALRPLRAIRDTADQIAAGSLAVRAGQADAPDEVAHLSRAFDAMVDRLAAAIEDERSTHQQMRRFLDDASHELRTPLTALTGTLEVLQGQAGTDAETVREGLRAVYRQARRMSALVAGLLSLARAERPDGLPLVPTDLQDVLENIRPTVERLTADHRLEWAKPVAPLPVLADSTILGSAVLNVIENAVRYSPLGTPIRIATRSDHATAELAISDQGPGIPADCLPHVFERFYRGRPATPARTEASQGTGLGLAVVRSVMLQHHGQATIDSIVDSGTTVRLRLPLDVPGSPDPKSSHITPGGQSSSASPRRDAPARSPSRSSTSKIAARLGIHRETVARRLIWVATWQIGVRRKSARSRKVYWGGLWGTRRARLPGAGGRRYRDGARREAGPLRLAEEVHGEGAGRILRRLGPGHAFPGGRKTLGTSQRRNTICLQSYYSAGGVTVGSKSVRLGADLERDLRSAAEVLGIPQSELIRQAVAERRRHVLSDRLDVRLADYVGVVSRGGGRAQATGQAFRDVLNQRRLPQS